MSGWKKTDSEASTKQQNEQFTFGNKQAQKDTLDLSL